MLVTPLNKHILEQLELYTKYKWAYSNKKPTDFT